MVIPGEPLLRGRGDLLGVLGDGSKILECVDAIESAGMNETHEYIADQSASLGLEEQRVFAVADRGFQSTLAKVVVQWGAGYAQEQRQFFPVLEHVFDRAAHATVRLDSFLLELGAEPVEEPIHDRLALLLVKGEALLFGHALILGKGIVLVDLA